MVGFHAVVATARGLRFVRLDPEWYGFDPIHIRPQAGKKLPEGGRVWLY
jgi:hypothetical protein